ncbi:TonB-dependent receptor [Saprospiraceae bacterium]|nr:TonB-dependent receptor [Saprospiraceae bacterium]
MKSIRSFFILLFTLLSFSAFSQEYVTDITFDAKYYQVPLSEVLVDVSKLSKINISFDPKILAEAELVTINVEDVSLGDFLDVVLDGLPITYRTNGRQIILLVDNAKLGKQKIRFKELTGFIEDGSTGERLPFAYLYSLDRQYAVTTNEYGYYNIQVPEDVEEIMVSYLGYNDTLVSINALESLIVAMRNSTKLREVVIVDKKQRDKVTEQDIYVSTNIDKLKKVESFLGEFDVIRYINTLPGVSTGADGLGGTSVRGANADNNLILLDGIPVYNSAHALGVFSIFNQESIKSASFHRSHIPSQYGGRLSSVLDIRTKEGSLTKYGASVSLGVLTAKAFVEGPIIKDKLSFALSGRRTILEPYLQPVSELVKRADGTEGKTDYKFGDFNAKIQLVINEKNRLYVSYYGGFDSFNDATISEVEEEFSNNVNQFNYDWYWGNQLIVGRWSSQFSDKLFSNLSIYNSSYNFDAYNFSSTSIDSTEVNLFYRADASLYSTSINDYGLNWNMDYFVNGKNSVKFGLSAVNHSFEPGLISRRINDPALSAVEVKTTLEGIASNPSRDANELDVYVENKYNSKSTVVSTGLRASLINSQGKSYIALQPRIAAKFLLFPGVFAKVSGNITNQYLHLLASSGLGLPTDIWIPSTADIKPQRAYQAAGGFDFRLRKNLYFSSEVYYKFLENVLNLKEGAVFSVIEDEDWETNLPVGKGEAFGIELGLKGQWSRHFFNFNYTYGKSIRQFESINSGLPFFSRFDRRHQGKFIYQVQINKNISANVNWLVATGHPLTIPTNIENNEFIYTRKNNQRLPLYDRLDVGINISNDFSWGSQTIVIGVFNAYNKKNPYYYFLEVEGEDVSEFQAKQVTIFPLLPNISYTIKF